MADLDVRLLGRFEVRVGERLVGGFESRKVRALFAYLALGDDQLEPNRARVAALLWPDQPEAVGRRNLRQALYNIRQTLTGAGLLQGAVVSEGSGRLALNPDIDLAVDVLDFERLMARGLNGGGAPGAEALARALSIYRGEFLDGLYLEDGLTFEEWLLLRRERLRDLAIDGARALVANHRERGEDTQAVITVRRWLELDPLSEEGHRSLMELYARSGSRSRALAQYESCVSLLRVELGVEPMAETKELLEAILAEEVAQAGGIQPVGDSRPAIPLVGRRQEYACLRESWRRVDGEGGRIVVVQGEAGIGKTRLVKTFIHGVAATDQACVLFGGSFRGGCVPATLGMLADIFRSARGCDPTTWSALLDGDPALKRYVSALLDGGSSGGMVGRDAEQGGGPWGPGWALSTLVQKWPEVCRHRHDGDHRLILLLENLHWADDSTLEAIRGLASCLADTRVWVVCTLDVGVRTLTAEELAGAQARSRVDILRVERLEDAAVREVGEALVAASEAEEVSDFVAARSAGLPLAAAELLNLLCDEGLLVSANTSWRLAGRLADGPPDELGSLDEVLARRIAALYGSSRRVAVAASVMGQLFDVTTLAAVVNESLAVLEPVLYELLQRGFVRFLPTYWFESRRERDLVLWGRGARRGVFQLGSNGLAGALVQSIPWERRVVLHRRIADVLAAAGPGSDGTGHAEAVAGHLIAAGEEERALPWIARACERALALGAFASAAAAAELGLGLCAGVEPAEPRWRATFTEAAAARSSGAHGRG